MTFAPTHPNSYVYAMGSILGQELRAYYNDKQHNSLDTWSPTISQCSLCSIRP